MISPKLLLSLMVLAGTQSAPQISERQVVGDVLAQLQPAITRAINSIGGGGSSGFGSSSFSGGSRGIGSSSFSGGNRGFSSGGSSFSAPITRFTPSVRTSAPRTSSFSSGGGASVSSVTSSVVSSLQPSIAAAVAQALAGSRRPSVGISSEDEFEGPAQYDYSYKVADDQTQAYIAHQESREGEDVTGSYNYVDPTGSLVTVNYQAGPDGFSQTRDVQKGAVTINPENIPGPYNGPLAGIDDVAGAGSGVTSGRGQARPSGLSQSDLIAQILASIQPQISSAVQGAISSNSRGSTGFRQNSFSVAPRVSSVSVAPRISSVSPRIGGGGFSSGSRFGSSSGFGSSQGGLVRNIISNLQPRISSAVNSAISSSRSAPVSRSRSSFARPSSQASAGGNLAGLFGVPGETSFRLETPDVAIQY